jgi:hypothetical protein
MFAQSFLFILVIVSLGVHSLNALTGNFPLLNLWWLIPLGVGLDIYVFESKALVIVAMAIVLIIVAGMVPQRALR